MNREAKDSVIFIVASLIDLADMTESDLQEVVELVGADSVQKLLDMGHLRFEVSYEEMAREICSLISWEPALVSPWRRDEDLSRLGLLIAEVIDGSSLADEDVAEKLFAFLSWEGIGEWLSINNG